MLDRNGLRNGTSNKLWAAGNKRSTLEERNQIRNEKRAVESNLWAALLNRFLFDTIQ